MMGELFFILIFMGVMALAALVFGAWFMVMIFRGTARAFGSLFDWSLGGRNRRLPGGRSCPRPGCEAPNPVQARFCRRCGQQLGQRVTVRRVALW